MSSGDKTYKYFTRNIQHKTYLVVKHMANNTVYAIL